MNDALSLKPELYNGLTHESYRQLVIGQLRLWEGKMAHLNADMPLLEENGRLEYESRLRQLQKCNRIVFALFGAYLLADEGHREKQRKELDVAVTCMQQMLNAFTSQPALARKAGGA